MNEHAEEEIVSEDHDWYHIGLTFSESILLGAAMDCYLAHLGELAEIAGGWRDTEASLLDHIARVKQLDRKIMGAEGAKLRDENERG